LPAVIILNPSRLLSENKFPHLVPFSKFSLTLTTSVVPSTSKNKGTRLGCPIGSFLSTHLLLLLGPMPRHAACTAPLISMAASPYRWPSMSICLRTVCRNSCSPLAAASRPVGLKNILSWHGLFFWFTRFDTYLKCVMRRRKRVISFFLPRIAWQFCMFSSTSTSTCKSLFRVNSCSAIHSGSARQASSLFLV